MEAGRAVRVLAIADTDSYLKWSVATLRRLPESWRATQLVVNSPVPPSAAQMRAAGRDGLEVLSYAAVIRRIRHERPDVVLLAATGPTVATLTASRVFRSPDRPVILTGLPGISIPASPRAVTARVGCDLLVVHSRREIAEFSALVEQLAPTLRLGLAHLPFLDSPAGEPPPGPPPARRVRRVVFAAQATVPPEREQRRAVLRALAEVPSAVVKVRAVGGEQQTHHERWPYPTLLAELEAAGDVEPGAVTCIGGAMSEALDTASCLVTVSSTAALEAIARDLPLLVLTDFGVSDALINTVFADSGCLGSLADLRTGRANRADPEWQSANYFHPGDEDTWLTALDQLIVERSRSGLARPRVSPASRPTRLRRRWRLLVPSATARRIARLRRGTRDRR